MNQQFVLYECFECKNKTAYCQLCSKIIGKLFNDIFFKCGKCNIISRTVTKEIVTSVNMPNPFPMFNSPPVSKDFQKVFSNSIMKNESIARDLFGNANLSNSSVPINNLISTNPYSVVNKSPFESSFTLDEFSKTLSLRNAAPVNLSVNLANNYTMITDNNNTKNVNNITNNTISHFSPISHLRKKCSSENKSDFSGYNKSENITKKKRSNGPINSFDNKKEFLPSFFAKTNFFNSSSSNTPPITPAFSDTESNINTTNDFLNLTFSNQK